MPLPEAGFRYSCRLQELLFLLVTSVARFPYAQACVAEASVSATRHTGFILVNER